MRKAYNLTAQIAMIVAIYDRIRKGLEIIPPDRSLTHAGNFLWMLNGVKPSETATRTLDIALILHADHELNASTFAARVIAATLSDIHSAITGAIGALKGPLHGGANEGVMRLLYTIDKAGADPVEYVKNMLAAKQKISGFGHRVYKTEDPRATHLRRMSEQLGKDSGQPKWYEMSRAIELYINKDKKLNANVDFYSASTYATLGIDIDLYTPIFAVSRIAGWAAHVIEQLDDNRLIRPRAEYIGPVYPLPLDSGRRAPIKQLGPIIRERSSEDLRLKVLRRSKLQPSGTFLATFRNAYANLVLSESFIGLKVQFRPSRVAPNTSRLFRLLLSDPRIATSFDTGSHSPGILKGTIMILGMSLSAFTTLHVIISLIGIASGFIVVLGMIGDRHFPAVTSLFFVTTALDQHHRVSLPVQRRYARHRDRNSVARRLARRHHRALWTQSRRSLARHLRDHRDRRPLFQLLRIHRAVVPKSSCA